MLSSKYQIHLPNLQLDQSKYFEYANLMMVKIIKPTFFMRLLSPKHFALHILESLCFFLLIKFSKSPLPIKIQTGLLYPQRQQIQILLIGRMGCVGSRSRQLNQETINLRSQTSQQLLSDIEKVILDNPNMYGLLSPSLFEEMLKQYHQYYYSPNQKNILITHLLNYLKECQDRSAQPRIQKQNYFSRFGKNIQRVQNESLFQNKNALKVMTYLARTQNQNNSYFDLKFNLERDEAISVAGKTREFCSFDFGAFFYLTNYLVTSCKNIESKDKKSVKQIETILIQTLEEISSKYPSAPKLIDSEEVNYHSTIKMNKKSALTNETIDLTEIEESRRKQKLTEFIVAQGKQACSNYKKFTDLIQEVCTDKGIHFKIGVKIQDQSDQRNIQHLIKHILKDNFKKYSIQDFQEITEGNNKTVQSFIEEELKSYRQQISEIYIKTSGKIKLDVSGILWAKCSFNKVEDINQCVTKLKAKIQQNKQFKLLGLQNRLIGEKDTSDIILKILVGKTVAQLQLSTDFNITHNKFANTIKQILSSQFYSPLTTLQVINEQLKKDYLQEVSNCFAVKSDRSQQKEKIDYQTLKAYLEDKVEQLLQKVKFYNGEGKERDLAILSSLKEQFQKLAANELFQLPEAQKHKVQKNNGEYFSGASKPAKSSQQFQKYLKIIDAKEDKSKQEILEIYKMYIEIGNQKRKQPNIDDALVSYLQGEGLISKWANLNEGRGLFYIGSIYQEKGNNEKALDYYNRSSLIQERVKGKESIECLTTYTNIATIYDTQQNYEKALQYYGKVLLIQQQLKGKKSMDCVNTLTNIGFTYDRQEQPKKALEYYLRSLQIEERVKGKGSIGTASTLNNIGIVHDNQKNYVKALEYYERCLQIQEKIQGKESIDCATTLKNIATIYENQKDYDKTIEYYQRCLHIKEKVKGKESIDCANTLSSIAVVYRNQENYQKALEYYGKCLQIKEKVKGKGSIDCANTISNIATVYKNQGNYDKALEYYGACLQIKERTKGKDSNDCAATLKKIGQVYKSQGKDEKAQEYFERFQSIKKAQK